MRDYINGEQFAELMDRKGIARDDTVVIYGDKSNWWAACKIVGVRCSVTPTCDSTAAVTSGSPSAKCPGRPDQDHRLSRRAAQRCTIRAFRDDVRWPSWALSR